MTDEARASETTTESAPVAGEPAVLRDTDDKIIKTMERAYDQAQRTPQPSKLPPRLPDESSFPRAAIETGKTDQAEATEETAVSNNIKPPPSWDAKARAKWGSLDPELREYIVKRESEAQARLSEFGRGSKQLGELGAVFEQHRDSIPRLPDGQPMPPHSVIQHLLTANRILEQNPREAIEWLARSKGIDLASEYGQQHAPQQIDLEQVRQEVRQEVLQQHYQQQHAAQEQQTSSYIATFAADKPYWPQIENDVMYHILAVKGTNPEMDYRDVLQVAHDRALKDRPEFDPRLKAKEATARQEAVRKAVEAKRLASLNVGSRSPGRSVNARRGSLEDTMRDVADRLMSD